MGRSKLRRIRGVVAAWIWATAAGAVPPTDGVAAFAAAQEHFRAGDPESAARLFAAAREHFRAAADPAAEAAAVHALALAQAATQAAQVDAGTTFTSARRLFRTLGDLGGEAEVASNHGLYHAERGRPDLAFAALLDALDLARRADDELAEARALHNLGGLSTEVGEVYRAREYLADALALHRRTGDADAEAAGLHNLGLLDAGLGRFDDALAAYREALLRHRERGDLAREAGTRNNIALLLRRLGDLDGAHDQLLASLRASRSAGDRRVEADVLLDLAAVEIERHRLDAAAAALDQAAAFFRAFGDRRGEGAALAVDGRLLHARGALDVATDRLREAVDVLRAARDPHGLVDALFELALAERARGRAEPALDAVEAAVDEIESLRSRALGDDLRAAFLASRRRVYDLRVELLVEIDADDPTAERAWLAAEAAKARGLYELLGERREELAKAPAALDDELRRLRRRIIATADRSDRKGDGELAALLAEHRRLEAGRRDADPRYAALARPPAIGLAETRALLEPGTLLLAFHLGDGFSVLWAVTDEGVDVHRLGPRGPIETAARRWHALLGDGAKRATAGPSAMVEAELAERLLAPVASQLAGADNVLLVVDGSLHLAPIAALRSPADGRPLGLSHGLSRVPSVAVLAGLRQRDSRPAAGTLAVLADPAFGEDGGPISLPGTRLEAESLAALVAAEERLVAVGVDARRELALGGTLAAYRYVHFATHAVVDDRHPELSGLVLAQVDELGRRRDGHLRLLDIYRLDLTADLVVLSACRTAIGKALRGEGLVGLSRGFLHAGAGAVLVSLWAVDDDATRALMETFYAALLADDLRPAAALRHARGVIAADPRWRHPYFWAGFVLQGS